MKTTTQKKRNKVLPTNLVENLKVLGATVLDIPEEKLFKISILFGDTAYNAFENWICSLEENIDPTVMAVVNPSPNIIGTTLAPNPALTWPIQNEANSIIAHYAPLRLVDFAGGAVPVIGGVIFGLPLGVPVAHASITLSKIFSALQNPPNVQYPTITGLSSGCYICNVIQMWSNAFVTVSLFKP
jgi:hypothetical protein